MRHFLPRHSRCSMKNMMMWNTWTKWCSTPKLLQLEIDKRRSKRDLSKSGLKNRKDSIWWWKSKDSRLFNSKKKEKLRERMLRSKVHSLSLTKSRKEKWKELRNKKWESVKCNKWWDKSNLLSMKKLNKLMRRDKESTNSWMKWRMLINKQLAWKNQRSWRRRTLKWKLLIITVKKPWERKSKWPSNAELKRRRNVKCRDLESSKRKPKIDKQKLMHLEQREPSKRARESQEKKREKN